MSFAGKQSEEVEGQRAALAITECIAAWLTEIKDKFKGRFPDDVRAAHRAVHQAAGFSAKATEHSASAAAQGRALDTNPALIIEERRCWHAWFAGDVDGRVAMHIQMWADKYPEEWADFIAKNGWCKKNQFMTDFHSLLASIVFPAANFCWLDA